MPRKCLPATSLKSKKNPDNSFISILKNTWDKNTNISAIIAYHFLSYLYFSRQEHDFLLLLSKAATPFTPVVFCGSDFSSCAVKPRISRILCKCSIAMLHPHPGHGIFLTNH